jgi:hypothetical protein
METRIQAGGGGNELSYDKNTIWWLWENWDLMGFNGILNAIEVIFMDVAILF